VVVDDNNRGNPNAEAGGRYGRLLNLAGNTAAYPSEIEIHDTWRHGQGTIMASKAFTDVIFSDPNRVKEAAKVQMVGKADKDSVIVRLCVDNTRVEKGHSMGVIGSSNSLGQWEDGKVTVMRGDNYPQWEVDVVVPKSQFPLFYRYVVVDQHKKVQAVEQGEDCRRLHLPEGAQPVDAPEGDEGNQEEREAAAVASAAADEGALRCIVQNDDMNLGKWPLYKTQWRGAGIALPVFGLRSEHGMGVGEFLDLKSMADWCARSKMKILQLLPVTDTTTHWDERDSYPYSSISVFALHPLYLRVQAIKGIPADLKSEAEKEVKRLNDPKYYSDVQWDEDLQTELDRPVHYPEVINTKRRLLWKIYQAIGAEVLESEEFKAFFERNERWIRPYGVFCWLRDFFGTANHENWGALGTGKVSMEKLKQLSAPDSDLYKGISFYWVVQYWLHLQLKEASEYCQSKGVVLKGDLPIGIDHDSVDAWFEPHLFNMHKKTGAPPDDYAQDGQNWGFPTYNWGEMRKDGFGWWRARLGAMAEYFHAYRIDHILGFFRIWEMPASATGGLLGKFSPSLPITKEELDREGIDDIDRLCEPYVKRHLMERLFGHDWKIIADKWFDSWGGDTYRFKPGLWSEVAIRDIVAKEGSPIGYKQPKEILQGMNTLINNVILLRDDHEPWTKFYPRIEMWKTSSFDELHGNAKHKLRTMYEAFFWGKQDQYWADEAMMKLPPLLDASSMLVCGEDLGMIPACVAGVLDKLGIMGLRIQRMPPPSAESKFGHCDSYPYMSVCTASCHDMSTVAGWWEEDQGRRQEFWNNILQRPGEAPHKCTPEVATMITEQHLWAPSCFAIFPIQDLFAMEDSLANHNPKADQINWPPNPAHYWRWRSKVSVEDLLKNNNFADRIKNMVLNCGRDGGY